MKEKVQESAVEKFVAIEKSHAGELLISIKIELEDRERDCEIFKQKFDKNFLDALTWYGEEMCIQAIWVQQLTRMNKLLNDGVAIEEVFKQILNTYEEHLQNPNNVRVGSNSVLWMELSIYKYKTYMEIRSYLLDLKKQFPKAF